MSRPIERRQTHHAIALAEHLRALLDLHADDEDEHQHADPVAEIDDGLFPNSFVITARSGRTFSITVTERVLL